MKVNSKALFILFLFAKLCFAQKILIPMDGTQKDHLKAYGVAFWVIQEQINVEWILNYKGGSFMTDDFEKIQQGNVAFEVFLTILFLQKTPFLFTMKFQRTIWILSC